MSIEHHPPNPMLAAFAAGTLDHGQHIAIATHLIACPHCRRFAHSVETVGGAVLEGLAPATMSSGALAAIEARLNEPARPAARTALPSPEMDAPGLPAFVRRYHFGSWKWIAPSVHIRRIELPYPSDTRVFLLKSGPGTKMLEHTHTGIELTCILSGAFRQQGAHYGPGDFDLGDESIDHQPVVEPGQDCICLVAMLGDLQLKGLIGRVVQPFIRL
jgi:putative transcriptional regulator